VRTHTEFMTFSKLASTAGSIPVVVVALVYNDLAIANSSMGRYMEERTSRTLGHVGRGGTLYFARLLCGHLYEGMPAIAGIRDDACLNSVVSRCRADAAQAFASLCDCLPGGSEHKSFKERVGWIRNRIAFHYGQSDLSWAMHDRSKRAEADRSTLTAGEDILSSRFEFGDDLMDSIVCRKLWCIPRSADLRTESDRIGEWCNMKTLEFLRFGSDFVPRFLRERRIVI